MKDLKFYSIGILVLLTVYLVAEYNKPAPINWQVDLRYNSKTPFGNFILFDRLKDIFPDATIKRTNQSPYDVFTDSSLQSGNYIIIAKTASFNKTDTKALLKYISAGNTVFISALNWDGSLTDSLKVNTGYEFDKKNPAVNFTNPKIKQAAGLKTDKFTATQYFSGFDTTKAVVLTQNNYKHATYLKYNFGKGSLLLMANPQLLTNYCMVKPGGAAFADRVLSYIPTSDHIYWDQYQNSDILEDESPIRVFFRHPGLQWAYYISLAATLLFVLYNIKRRQRPIPVVDPLKNATLGFVTVVGNLYYEQRDNTDIAVKKITYFLEHLRNTYNLKTGTFDNDFLNVFIKKTGVEEKLGHDLINHMRFVLHQTKVSDAELIEINRLMEKFYSQTAPSYGK
ncbi:DUF4350 domain-containing protein [Mucilaginibacter sp. 21P]|uniref:DUF4350 domain-containing protein n=1 Tax=Mucilaginibacter sp. 21P TaxID=2778902 RepID=UPI001C56116C|nr:DUF4350 domain-containing protein [Mucilaginibacter sp. 21P]QXV65691.1 DUF4350 domain-containing protein [Mucilaginibacter sp. 21P]